LIGRENGPAGPRFERIQEIVAFSAKKRRFFGFGGALGESEDKLN
jgi:hypothetical protein